MAEDKVTEEALEGAKQKKEKKGSWIKDVPTGWLVGALILIAILVVKGQTEGWNKVLVWIIMIGLGLYLLSISGGGRKDFLTEPEAKALLAKRIAEKRITKEIPRNVYIPMPLNAGEQFIEGNMMYYIIGLEFYYPNGKYEYKQVRVGSKPPFNITFQDSIGRISGREALPIIDPWKRLRKFKEKTGIDPVRGIFSRGGG